MIGALARELASRWCSLTGDSERPATLRLVQQGGTGRRGGRVHFGVLDAEGVPRLFARTPRDPLDATRLTDEYQLLRRLREDPRLAQCVSEPLALLRVEGATLLVERAAGDLLSTRLHRLAPGRARRFRAHLALVDEPLAQLALVTRQPLAAAALRERVLAPLAECLRAAGQDPATVERVAAPLLDTETPSVLLHGDFNPNNLALRPAGGVTMIDWEDVQPQGLPLSDLFYFMSRYAWRGAIGSRLGGARSVLAFYRSSGALARAARCIVERHASQLALAPRQLPALFRLHFLQKAEIKRRTAGLDSKATQSWLGLFQHFASETRAGWLAAGD